MDTSEILNTVEQIYDSNTNFQILKDFERVLDELDVYVFENWEDGEIASGPFVDRHWVMCKFMWPYEKMPDPSGGKRLLDYNCQVKYITTEITEPRPIRKPSDIRPGTRKGKLDSRRIWLVEITMPKKLISDIWIGYQEKYYTATDVLDKEIQDSSEESQPADNFSADPETAQTPDQSGGEQWD